MLVAEEEVKLHPYQKRGPKGAYEAKQVTGSWNGGKKKSCRGLYVRVDMPGVPDDGVKISKYSDTRTVTFTGKAPVVWAHIDSSDRVYAGYVVLDRDPAMVDVECRVKNGSLHLFFPCSDGSLHFLSPNNSSIPPQQEYDDDTVELIEIGELFITHIEHAPEEPSGIKLRGGRPEHINPYLLSGVRGVYEHKIVSIGHTQHLIYVRLDVPMTNYKLFCLTENADRRITFAVDAAEKDSTFDEGLRGYIGSLVTKCECCQYEIVKYDITDGVIRFLASKSSSVDLRSNIYCYEPPSRPGQPPKRKAFGNLRVSFEKPRR
ncbi:hypothetical protein SOVF_116210 [Spinacia oleracea]|nr:hypothetical protein SOVF_116210 [Spinacia oleracea]